MKKDEAKKLIYLLWKEIAPSDKIKKHPMLFYQWLKKEHPEVLKFRSSRHEVDQYQVISAWLNSFSRDN